MKIDGFSSVGFEQATLNKKTSSDKSFENILQNVRQKEDDKALKNACEQLESVFIHKMFSQMRASIPNSGFIEKSQGEQIFQDMLDEEYSKEMSKTGGIGLADILYNQLSMKKQKTEI